ncbi:MAG: hypothetical protein AAF311_05230 [Pseudomonadota bacterium]
MTIFEELEALSTKLSDAARAEFIQNLARLHEIYDVRPEDVLLSPEQEAELDRRLANPNPKFIPAEEVFAEFGRRMPRG